MLLTRATGSFGSAFIKRLMKTRNCFFNRQEKLIAYSRDWQKQKELRDSLNNPDFIEWVIGDIRDKERLIETTKNIDIVIHAAAIKEVTTCEDNPTECLLTNVIGTQNVIDAIKLKDKPIKAILISTDKAVLPINTYGTSKKMAEKLWINANNGAHKLSVCRYGNVIGSNGSVLPLYRKMISEGANSLPVTDERMTRFWYQMEDAIDFVLESLYKMNGGEVLIPTIPSIRIIDLCRALDMPYHEIGIRPGEKLHEFMIPPDDVSGDNGYSSGNNPHFLSVDEIRRSIDGV